MVPPNEEYLAFRMKRWAFLQLPEITWRTEVIRRFRIPFLHVKDLWNPNASKYKHLSQSDRNELFDVSKSLIVQHVDIGVGCAIKRDDFMGLSSHEQRSRIGTDYTIGVTYCLNVMRQYLGSSARRTTLSVFLENGHRNTRQAISILKSERDRQQSSFDVFMKTDEGATIWRDPDRDDLGIKLGVVDTGNKATMPPLQAADLIAFGVLSAPQNELLWDTLRSFGASFPLLVYEPSAESLHKAMRQMEESGANARHSRRRFDSVLREIKRKGGTVKKVDTDTYILDGSEIASAESSVLNRLGLSEDDMTLSNIGQSVPPEAVLRIQCTRCLKVFTLRGFSQHMELFVCPECGQRHVQPKPIM